MYCHSVKIYIWFIITTIVILKFYRYFQQNDLVEIYALGNGQQIPKSTASVVQSSSRVKKSAYDTRRRPARYVAPPDGEVARLTFDIYRQNDDDIGSVTGLRKVR